MTQTSPRRHLFDGTYVRGAFFGVFDMPQQPGTPTQAPISGEGGSTSRSEKSRNSWLKRGPRRWSRASAPVRRDAPRGL